MCRGKILFILNPSSGSYDEGFFRKKIVTGAKQAWLDSFDLLFLTAEGFSLIKNKIACYDTIVIGGGDGTISFIVNLLADMDKKPAVALIPLGTGNDLCRSLGIFQLYRKKGFKGIVEIIKQGKTAKIDLIKISTNKYFINYFGLGSDAMVAHDFENLRKKSYVKILRSTFCNKIFFSLLGMKNLFSRINHDIILKIKTDTGYLREELIPKKSYGFIINNITSYAGGASVCSFSNVNDGKFEVVIISNLVQLIFLHFTRFINKPLDCLLTSVRHFQAGNLTVEFSGKTPCQIDGEAVKYFPKGLNNIDVSTYGKIEIFVP